jgi:RNA recognition motif-containing protein
MNLFVGNLHPDTLSENLRILFTEFGEVVSSKVIFDNATGLSKGFGFVEMAERGAAYDAINNLDQSYFEGNIISVKEAKQNTGGGRPGNSSYGRKPFRPGGSRDGNSGGYNRGPREGGSGGGYNRGPRDGDSGGYNRTPRDGNSGGYNRTPRDGNSGGYNRTPRDGNSGGYNRTPRDGNSDGYNRGSRDGNSGGYNRDQSSGYQRDNYNVNDSGSSPRYNRNTDLEQ